MTHCQRGRRILLACAVAACAGQEAHVPDPGTVAAADTAPEARPFDSLFDQASEVYFAGAYDSAAALLTSIRDHARRTGDVPAEARALTWIGLAYWRRGDYRRAETYGEEALALKKRHGLVDQYWRSYNALGLLAWIENRLSDAERYYLHALAMAREQGARSDEATTLGNLALVQTELAQFAAARDGFMALQHVHAELGDARLEGNAYTNLGMLEIRLGNARDAIPLLHRALELYQSIDYGTGVQSALGQLGTAYQAVGDARQAFIMLDSALVIATAQGLQQEQASILEAMAELYRAAGDHQRALTLYDSAMTLNADLEQDIETGIDLRGEADIRIRLGDMAGARRASDRALEIHRRAGAPLEVIFDLSILAEVLDRLEAPEESRAALTEAHELAARLDARVARVAVGLAQARIADRHRRSLEVLTVVEALEPDLSRGGFASEWEARWLQSRALERLGRRREAIVAARRALATVERVRSNYGSGMLRTAFVADKREVYGHLIGVLLRAGDIEEAFAVADAARGRALLERLPASISPALPATGAYAEGALLLSEIDRLVESIDYTEEIPPEEMTAAQRHELASLYTRLEAARREYEGLIVQAAETDPDRAALLGGAHLDVATVQRVLHRDEMLVEYFVPVDGPLTIFALSGEEIHALRSPVTAQNVASRVRLARDLAARQESAERADAVLTGLHGALIDPLMQAGLLDGVRALIIVPHRSLAYLPFAALRNGTTERYLVEDFVLKVVPSAAVLQVLGARRRTGTPAWPVSAFAPFPERLPASRLEVRAIPGDRVRRYEGARASEKALRRALQEADVVHVATHGVMNARNPMFSRLELARNGAGDPADDGRLEVHELLTMSIVSSLVFLSGCETGLGGAHATAFSPGEDYATLAQAFLQSGAGAVLATLWPVEDAGAAVLADHFYTALPEAGPAEGLARAQRTMLASERYRAPYFWAAYQLAGANGSVGAHTRAMASVSEDTQQSE